MTYAPENLNIRYARVQRTIAALCPEQYDDNPTAAVIGINSMLVVTVVGTLAVSVLALLLCLFYAGLAMTAFIANIVRGPAVQQTLRRRLPGAASTVDGEMASCCVSAALDLARRVTATLAFGIWFVTQSIGTAMFLAVELIAK